MKPEKINPYCKRDTFCEACYFNLYCKVIKNNLKVISQKGSYEEKQRANALAQSVNERDPNTIVQSIGDLSSQLLNNLEKTAGSYQGPALHCSKAPKRPSIDEIEKKWNGDNYRGR